MAGINFTGGLGLDGLPRMDWHVFKDHFDNYTAGDWVITETGTGTRAISDARGGILLITNAAADDDANFLQWSGTTATAVAETFAYSAAKRAYFGMRFKVSDATQSDFVCGWQVTDTTPLAVANGIYFRKDDGDANIDCVVISGSTATTVSAAATAADDTYMTLEWEYNGDGNFSFYKDGVPIGGAPTTNAPTTELAVSFGIQNGAGAAKSMSIDWIMAAEEI